MTEICNQMTDLLPLLSESETKPSMTLREIEREGKIVLSDELYNLLDEKYELFRQYVLLDTFPSMLYPEEQDSPKFENWKQSVSEYVQTKMIDEETSYLINKLKQDIEIVKIEHVLDVLHELIDTLQNEYKQTQAELVSIDNQARKKLIYYQLCINELKINIEIISCYF